MKKAFTLIEIMVAVAILAILTGIVLVSLQTTQQRARDNKRIGDINQLQLLLNQYYDQNKVYPVSLTELVTGGYVSTLPKPPQPTNSYLYIPLAVTGYNNTQCLAYHLGTTLENAGTSQLNEDAGTTFDGYTICWATGTSATAADAAERRICGETTTCGYTGAACGATSADQCYNQGSF